MLHSSGMDGWIGVKIGMQTQGRVPTTLAWGRVQGSVNRYGGSRGGGLYRYKAYNGNYSKWSRNGLGGRIWMKFGRYILEGKTTGLDG